jgi:hypothetical protein
MNFKLMMQPEKNRKTKIIFVGEEFKFVYFILREILNFTVIEFKIELNYKNLLHY